MLYLKALITFIYRFVMYQLSKNLNRPFFIEFLTEVSVKYAKEGLQELEEEEEDHGDNILTMLLKPSYTTQDSGHAATAPEYDDPGSWSGS